MSGAQEIFIQMAYYAVVMILTIFIMGIMQKGFFWVFVKVKTSFGKKIIVKIRAINRDYFRVGEIIENDLLFKDNGKEKRININRKVYPFYRSIGVLWIDLDDDKNGICLPDYSTVSGFDPVKTNNLLIRALYTPSVNENKEKIILFAILLTAALVIATAFMVYQQQVPLQNILNGIAGLNKGIIVNTGG